jgi:peptidoglycan/xylan/chitin deacetylase (PgdA/CDA1 family)
VRVCVGVAVVVAVVCWGLVVVGVAGGVVPVSVVGAVTVTVTGLTLELDDGVELPHAATVAASARITAAVGWILIMGIVFGVIGPGACAMIGPMRPGRKLALASVALLGAIAAALVLAPATVDRASVSSARRYPQLTLTAREARLAAREHAAINRVLTYTSRVFSGGRRGREVALTFDDGPGPFTPAVIATLKRLHVPATFFQVGTAIAGFPQFARSELLAGFGLGDHTETHPFLAALPPAAQRTQIVGEAHRIHDYGAPYPRLFRPPYESFDPATTRIARAAEMLMVLWSVDTKDYSRPGVARIAATTFAEVRPGAIILMHDGGGPRAQTVAALPRVILGLRRRGYRLVTVGRLMLDDPPPAPRVAAPLHHAAAPPRRAAAQRRKVRPSRGVAEQKKLAARRPIR